jgi:flagellar biosynthesis protein FlhG
MACWRADLSHAGADHGNGRDRDPVSTTASSIKSAYVLEEPERPHRRPFSLIVNDATEAEARTVHANIWPRRPAVMAAQLNFMGPSRLTIIFAGPPGRAGGDGRVFRRAPRGIPALVQALHEGRCQRSAYGMATDGASLGV